MKIKTYGEMLAAIRAKAPPEFNELNHALGALGQAHVDMAVQIVRASDAIAEGDIIGARARLDLAVRISPAIDREGDE
jgi:hypothetical protein